MNFSQGTWILTTFEDDRLLRVAGEPASSYGSLSPDGRYFLTGDTDPGMTVYDVRTGSAVELPDRAPVNYGWTPDGHVIGTATTGRPLLVAGTPGRSF